MTNEIETITINGMTLTKEERGAYKGCRTLYTFTSINGEQIAIEIGKCESSNSKSDLMRLWVKSGYLPRRLPSWWYVDVQYRTEKGAFIGYNPTIYSYQRLDKDGNSIEQHHNINFDWVLEATEENHLKLLAEIIDRANNKTPTAQKIVRETA